MVHTVGSLVGAPSGGQALWRGFRARAWATDELAADMHRDLDGELVAGVFDRFDNKRRVALRVRAACGLRW